MMALAITQMSVLPELMCLYKKRLLNQAKNKEYSLAPKFKELYKVIFVNTNYSQG
jgi:hypothetical protein